MGLSSSQAILLCAVAIVLLAKPTHAFGAGNIGSTSKIEGQNWRHGDLEDTLLTIVASRAMGGKKFSKLDIKRVYFGNWLRDYSQAVDVGTVKHVSAEAIRLLLWVLGFMSFGYGSGEFEVTTERLGCYRPEEHIDNPKDYADNEDARQYDRRLRGPVDERRELSINPQTGLKNYIASEGMGIDTSAGLVRKLFRRSIELGRQYARSKNKKDLYEALRLLGTGSHCLEDYAAHSNYVELALIELGERDVFPHVGRRTAVQLPEVRQPVYPIVTGTFGGVDFLHSVCGEFDDKTTQSEIQELEGTMQQYQNGNQDNSILQDLLNKVPSGLFGGKDQAGKADELQQNALNHQMQNSHISPRQPEEWARYLKDIQKQIYPIIEWHDEIMQSITETIEKIPILPDLIEQIQDEINKFVFTLLAPYVVPIITQVKNELNTGSSEIIQSSVDKQHIVFNDDHSSDPTHSMLSKDHFSNILNEPAGKVAQQIVKWVVPQIVACWDDERVDIRRTNDRIIYGVLHHPALRDRGQDGAVDGRRLMFRVVQEWWQSQSEREKAGLREQLSRRGVEAGNNHKPGVQDHGHGSNRPLGMANLNHNTQSSNVAGDAFGMINSALGGGSSDGRPRPSNSPAVDQIAQMAGAAAGGGVLGSLVGGLASGIGGDLLGGAFSQDEQTFRRDSYGQDGSHTETITQMGHSQSGDAYGQAQYTRTTPAHGGPQHSEFNRFEQRQEGGHWQSEVHHEDRMSGGAYHEQTRVYEDNDRPQERFPARHEGGENFGGHEQRHRHGGRNENEYENRRRDDEDNFNSRFEQPERPFARPEPPFERGGPPFGRPEPPFGPPPGRGGRYERQDVPSFEPEGYGDSRGYEGGRQEEPGYGPGGYGDRRGEEPFGFGGGGRQEFGSEGRGYGNREQDEFGASAEDYGREPPNFGRSGGRQQDEYEPEPEPERSYGGEEEDQGYGGRRYGEGNEENQYDGGYGGRGY